MTRNRIYEKLYLGTRVWADLSRSRDVKNSHKKAQRFCAFLRLRSSKSEHQLQRELDLPRCRGRIGDDAGRRTVVGPCEHDLIRIREIRVIEDIERLCPELHIQSLADSHLLEEGCVD